MPFTRLLTVLFVFSLAPGMFAQDAEQQQAQNPMEQFPKVVAVVNGQTITRDKLAQECLKRYGTIVLDNLLNKHLILQLSAKPRGLRSHRRM